MKNGGAGCLTFIVLCVIVAASCLMSAKTPVDDTQLIGLDGSDTVTVITTSAEWDNAAKRQVQYGSVAAGAYAMDHGAFLVPVGTHVHVLSRSVGEYAVLTAHIELQDGRSGWINRISLPVEAR